MAIEEGTEFGYEFQVHGELDDDTMTLFRELVERMRRDLVRRHLERGEGRGVSVTTASCVPGSMTTTKENTAFRAW